MSYNLRAFIEHEDLQGVLHRLEILKWDYGGAAIELTGDGDAGVHDFEHSELTSGGDGEVTKFYEKPIQEGILDIYPLIGTAADFTILEEIFQSPPDQFLCLWKQDGAEFWRGNPKTDILDWKEKAFPYEGHIIARDFEGLETIDYMPSGSLPTGRDTIISVIAELLSYTDYDLPIRTATSWIEASGDPNVDYLQQNYVDKYALREYAGGEGEEDQPIKVREALEDVLRNNCLVMKQAGGRIQLDQISEYEDPTAVLVTDYDSSGAQTGSSTIDTTISSGSDRIIIDDSTNKGFPALKRAEVLFDHRTKKGQLSLPGAVYLDGAENKSFNRDFIATNDQYINFSCAVLVYSTQNHTSGEASIKIRVGQYYWDGSSWVADSSAEVTRPLVGGGFQREGATNYYAYSGNFNIVTSDIPSDANTPMEITFQTAVINAGPDIVADESGYENISFSVVDPDQTEEEQEATSTLFRLEQTNSYPTEYEHGRTRYGDGPTTAARSAIRYSAATNDITGNSWGRRGGSADKNFHNNLLKEVLDQQREFVRVLYAQIEGTYDPTKVLSYDGDYFFYMGAQFSGYNGEWSVRFAKINTTVAGTDEFNTVNVFEANRGTRISTVAQSLAFESKRFINSQRITVTTADLTAGAITQIPIESVPTKFISVGDTFYLFNIEDASLTPFVLAEPQLPGATTMIVESETIDSDILAGSWLIFTGEKISTSLTQTDNAFRFSVRGDWSYMTDSNGDPIQFSDGEPLIDGEVNTNVVENKVTSEIALLQSQVIIKSDGAGGLAQVRLDSRAKEGSRINISADFIDINNINFNRAAGTIGSDNYVAETSGWQIKGSGDAEFNDVRVRESLIVDTEIRNITVKTGNVTIQDTAKFTNTDEDFSLASDGLSFKTGETFLLNRAIEWKDFSDGKMSLYGLHNNVTGDSLRMVMEYIGDNISGVNFLLKNMGMSIERGLSVANTLDANGLLNANRGIGLGSQVIDLSSGVLNLETLTSLARVSSESGSTDDLDTIQIGGATPGGNNLLILIANSGETITINDGVGNIITNVGNVQMDDSTLLMFVYVNNDWHLLQNN